MDLRAKTTGIALGLLAVSMLASAGARADGPPTAVIVVSPAGDGEIGSPLTFDASASANAAEIVWDFADGREAVGPVVSHAFANGGAYQVLLTVRNAGGQFVQANQEVRIAPYIAGKIVQTIAIPSQGISLHGTVTRPDAPGTFPAILEYGPYGAGGVSDGNPNRSLIRSGYAYVKVAMPGREQSGGDFDMFGASTAQAGYDAVEWIAAQSWSDGKVALAGFSGPAVAAMATLESHPPHLVTASIKAAFSDMYRDAVHLGGTENSNTFINAWNAEFYAEPAVVTQTNTPWAEVPSRTADITTTGANMAARTLYDDYWKERTPVATPANVPVLYYGTHRDLWPRSGPEIFRWAQPAGGRVLMVYGGHGPVDPTGYSPAIQLISGGWQGENAIGETRAWWDHYLKGIDNGVDRRAPLSLLVPRGADWNGALGYRWLGLTGWPDPHTRWETLHLDGGGILADGAPTNSAPDSALGGAAWGATGAEGDVDAAAGSTVNGAQQLVYETAPLDHETTVVGPVSLRLFASATGLDIAWNVQLQEVLANGSVRQINDGQLQASHRALDEAATRRTSTGILIQPVHRHDRIDLLEPDRAYEFDIEIPTVFDSLLPGSRLRITIVGNDARPTLDGKDTASTSVRFSVYHDALHPSVLYVPVIDNPDELRLPTP